jgi:hypothetical protein
MQGVFMAVLAVPGAVHARLPNAERRAVPAGRGAHGHRVCTPGGRRGGSRPEPS